MKRAVLAALIAALAWPPRASAAEPSLNHVLIRYKPGRGPDARGAVAQSFGVRPRTRVARLEIDRVPVPSGVSADEFARRLASNPDIEFAEPNGVLRAFDTPNDPCFNATCGGVSGGQYYLQSQTGGIYMDEAWDITKGDSSIVVAVLDTGVSLTHPDLVGNLWTNPNPSGNSGLRGTRTEIDWNGDGDCVDNDVSNGPEQCAGPDPTDDENPEFHGTHVAGIIAATTNNGINIAGVAQNSRIMAVKVLNSEGSGSFDSIANGIIYAADNGASVINLSLGGTLTSQTIASAVDYAIRRNIVVVAAAGNTIGPACGVSFPASLSSVIAVAATDRNDVIADFSCTGPQLDLSAPGDDMVSTDSNAGVDALDGTSFSAPLVSGVAALIRALRPSMSVADVTRYIDFNTDDLGAPGFDSTYGFGRLNATRAINAVIAGDPGTPSVDQDKAYSYPNPFNPTAGTTVKFHVPSSMSRSGLKVQIRTMAGELVKEINSDTWDGRNEDGNYVASGLYFFYAESGGGNAKGKLTVVK